MILNIYFFRLHITITTITKVHSSLLQTVRAVLHCCLHCHRCCFCAVCTVCTAATVVCCCACLHLSAHRDYFLSYSYCYSLRLVGWRHCFLPSKANLSNHRLDNHLDCAKENEDRRAPLTKHLDPTHLHPSKTTTPTTTTASTKQPWSISYTLAKPFHPGNFVLRCPRPLLLQHVHFLYVHHPRLPPQPPVPQTQQEREQNHSHHSHHSPPKKSTTVTVNTVSLSLLARLGLSLDFWTTTTTTNLATTLATSAPTLLRPKLEWFPVIAYLLCQHCKLET